jgi:hypothetical protein
MTPASDSTGLTIRQMICLFSLALAPRLLFLFLGPWQHPGRAFQPDSYRYLLLAEALHKHHTFGLPEPEELMHQSIAKLRAENGTLPPADADGLRPESFRTPGYPAFIAVIESLGGKVRAVLAIQCLMGAAMACLAAFIGQSLGLSVRGAFLVGLFWALHPGLIVFDAVLLTESLFNAVVVIALFSACRFRPPLCLIGAGVLLGVATLVRPLGLLYVPAVLAVAWPRLPSKFLGMMILVVAAGLLPGLWAFRNQVRGEGLRLTTVGDLNLLYYTAAYAFSEEHREDWLQSWPAHVEELTDKLGSRLKPEEDVVAAARRLALDEIRNRPGMVARVQAKSWLKLFFDHSLPTVADTLGLSYQPSGLFSALLSGEDASPPRQASGACERPDTGVITDPARLSLRIAALTWMGLNALIALAALAGIIQALRKHQWRILIFGGVSILLFTLATSSVGLERFRLPMMLPLFVLAANLFPFVGQAALLAHPAKTSKAACPTLQASATEKPIDQSSPIQQ